MNSGVGLASEQGTVQLAIFVLGSQEYALDIMRIRQILRPQRIRPVPKAPTFVDGVIELRGVVIPVIDLRRRFGVEAREPSRANKLIIARLQGRLMGLMVDSVQGVHRLSREEIRPAPHWIVGPESAVFSGVCRREDRLVLVLDLTKLLSSNEALHLGELSLPTADAFSEDTGGGPGDLDA